MKQNTKNPFPANPMQIFSVIERLRSQIKGNGMFADTIRQALIEEPNYWKIVKFIKDKGQENYEQTNVVVPSELLDEILEMKIPKHVSIS